MRTIKEGCSFIQRRKWVEHRLWSERGLDIDSSSGTIDLTLNYLT